MSSKIALVALTATLLAGCASVPMASKDASSQAKAFAPPSGTNAGLYIFRTGGAGGALKKDIWVDGKCIGESAQNVFFFEEVAGNQEHVISTESEFSPNQLKLTTASNTNYFIEQYMKMGVFVGGANLRLVDEGTGKAKIAKLEMATKGSCSQ
ncbi:DUF2846 domain-containing protein [Sinimarinibacterium sp. CAU 1509]|uniref:DUF2846 domain-containing protein n=1 Tax=Sinimarinibacterium sp. CAU 1509 TaxID=2562283 RepID=UPI0010ACD031|nr:DUF2846 domain-containing protein [Sinimarinibacterium sp. CAU 1509]TJY63234.1 DUF2846 domain-containing protein [Sinimarinibacterium sp. CAU 1509]